MYIKILKTLLHVSIIRSSSGSILCSLLKLQFKTLSDLLRYINLVLWQQGVCCVWVVRCSAACCVLCVSCVVFSSMWCVVCELCGVQQHVVCCVWVVWCSAACRVLCVSCVVFSSMSCVVCELCGVQHVEWLCRNKTCTMLHQVGVSFDLYYDARKHKIKI